MPCLGVSSTPPYCWPNMLKVNVGLYPFMVSMAMCYIHISLHQKKLLEEKHKVVQLFDRHS